MKNLFVIGSAAALLALGAAPASADQTNAVQHLNVNLIGLKQGPTVTNKNFVRTEVALERIGAGQIIAALGTATSNSFTVGAKLLIVTPLDGGAQKVAVQDGSNRVDVTSFVLYKQEGATVDSSVLNLKNGRVSSTDYSIQRLALGDAAGFPALTLHFDVSGLATEGSANNRCLGSKSEIDVRAAGPGESNGTPLVVHGQFRVSGYTIEVVPSNPPPNPPPGPSS